MVGIGEYLGESAPYAISHAGPGEPNVVATALYGLSPSNTAEVPPVLSQKSDPSIAALVHSSPGLNAV